MNYCVAILGGVLVLFIWCCVIMFCTNRKTKLFEKQHANLIGLHGFINTKTQQFVQTNYAPIKELEGWYIPLFKGIIPPFVAVTITGVVRSDSKSYVGYLILDIHDSLYDFEVTGINGNLVFLKNKDFSVESSDMPYVPAIGDVVSIPVGSMMSEYGKDIPHYAYQLVLKV